MWYLAKTWKVSLLDVKTNRLAFKVSGMGQKPFVDVISIYRIQSTLFFAKKVSHSGFLKRKPI
jgi:hypothetical protein